MFFFNNSIDLWLYWVFAAARRLSLGADSGDSSAAVCGLLTAAASAIAEPGSRVLGLQKLRSMGLAAPQHVGSLWTRDRTCVPCTDRWIFVYRPPWKSFVFDWLIGSTIVHLPPECFSSTFHPF